MIKQAAGSVLVAAVAVAAWWVSSDGSDEPGPSSPQETVSSTAPAGAGELATIDDEDLPRLAQETLDLIDAGGPFRCDKDDSTFGNYEGLLPQEDHGYYREYTVTAPGCPYRGALRIVEGAGGESYWTDDHYESFELVLE